MTSETTGSVAGIWRFPVKSMQGERIQHAVLTGGGLVGDRAYALIDMETGKVVSAKSVKLFPGVLGCRAAFLEPPRANDELPPVRITLPDGTMITSDSSNIDHVLSAYFRREVTLARTAPEDFTIDQYHPDVENLDPAGSRDIMVEQKVGSAYFAQAGVASPVPVGAFFDLFPMSLMTTSTLEQLNGIQPQSRFDERRFRMNLIVSTKEAGFVENGWTGRELTVGGEVRIKVVMPDPRCVMTTLAQEDLPKDTDILRALTRYNRIEVEGAGLLPCAGAYLVVEEPGSIRIDDPVVLI